MDDSTTDKPLPGDEDAQTSRAEAETAPETQEAAGEVARPRRRRRARRVGIVALVSLVLVAAVLGVAVLVLAGRPLTAPDWVRLKVEDQVNRQLSGVQVGLGQVTVVVEDLWHPRVQLSDIDISDAEGRRLLTLADVEGLVPDAVLDGLFAFTLVRNPWDRIVSYYHWLQGQRFDHPAVGLAQSLAFDAFVLHPQTRASFRATPAAHYMRRSDGREQCKAYVRLEHLAEDMAPVAFHLGFMPAVERINTSERDADYRRYYTEQTAEAVAEACAEDIARFGYCFDTRQGP